MMISLNLKSSRSRRTNPVYYESAHLIARVVGWQANLQPHVWQPPTDLYEVEDRYIVRVEIAGMAETNFTVSLNDNILTISGVRPDVAEKRAYHQMEIRFGEFSTALELPGPVDIDHITAEYSDGFLLVLLPKSRPIDIKVNEH
jgi:HSP20 family protein